MVFLVSVPLAQAGPLCEPLPGAIFTTTVNGKFVNANHYKFVEDVYLNGGPGQNAPPEAASLPDGCYFFQVTDPPGKTLLSTDKVKCRVFCVEGGVIQTDQKTCLEGKCSDYSDPKAITKIKYRGKTTLEEEPCLHDPGIDLWDDNGATIQLAPFEVNKRPGGVHKVWVTRVEDYKGDEDTVNGGGDAEGRFGFIPSCAAHYYGVRR